MEQNNRPGWYYVGNGRLRFKNAEGWTDEYRTIDEPESPTPPKVFPTEAASTVSSPGKRLPRWAIAATVTAVAVGGAWASGLLPDGIAAVERTWTTSSAADGADPLRPASIPPAGATHARSRQEVRYLRVARKSGAFPQRSDAKLLGVGTFACETARRAQPDGESMVAALTSASKGPQRADYLAAYTAAFTALCPDLEDFWTNAQKAHQP